MSAILDTLRDIVALALIALASALLPARSWEAGQLLSAAANAVGKED